MSYTAKCNNQLSLAKVRHPAGKQQGASLFAVLAMISVVAFLGLFAFKVVPNYLEFLTVRSIGSDISSNAELMQKSKSKVMQAISQAYRANSLWELKPEDSFVLTRDAGRGYLVQIDYEKRATLFSNIDVVTSFNHVYDDDI